MAFIDSGKNFDKEANHNKLKSLMKSEEIKQYPLRVPASLYKKVRVKLLKEDRSLKDLIISMLEEYIKE